MRVDEILFHLRLPAALVRLGEEGVLRVIATNPPMQRVYRLAEETFSGGNLLDFVHFTDDDALEQIASPELRGGEWFGSALTREPLAHHVEVVVRVTGFRDADAELIRLVVIQEREHEELKLALTRSREQFERLVNTSPDMNYLLDTEGRVLEMNPAGERLLGYSVEELRRGDYTFRLHPDDGPRVAEHFARVIAGHVETFETRLLTRDGDELLMDVLARPYVFGDNVVGLYGIARDITEKRRILSELRESEQRYRSLFDANSDAVLTFDLEGNFLQMNRATTEMMGYDEAELLGTPFLPHIVPELQEHTRTEFSRVLERRTVQYQTAMHTRSGDVVDLDITVIPIVIEGEMRGIHCIGKDITVHRQLSRELERIAFVDALTGLPNRNALDQDLDRLIEDGRSFTLLTLDVDRLKIVNDRWGRAMGDDLLRAVAARLTGHLVDGGRLYRYVGDDFIVVAEVLTELESAQLAQRLEQAMRAPFPLGEVQVQTSAAIGVAEYPSDGGSADALLQHSDDAKLVAKRRSHHRVVRYSTLDRSDEGRYLQLEIGIRRAVEGGELSLVYQPQIDLRTGDLHGVEALLRWTHPELGPISPEEFIPVAERTGEIHAIGLWVAENACAQLVDWVSRRLDVPALAINVSIDQFYNPDFADELERTICTARIAPPRLVLEITESIASNADIVVSQLERFARLGVRIAIDDFGTGYSSLSYLKDFPVDILKIDRTFVDQVALSRRDRDLVASITSLARNFDLETVAEGVESEGQLRVLRDLGVDHAQGFFIGRPVPAAEFEAWARDHSRSPR